MLFFSISICGLGLLGLGGVGTEGVDLVLGHKGADETEDHNEGGEAPRGLFQNVGRLADTHYLVGGGEIRGKATTFGVLNQHDKC